MHVLNIETYFSQLKMALKHKDGLHPFVVYIRCNMAKQLHNLDLRKALKLFGNVNYLALEFFVYQELLDDNNLLFLLKLNFQDMQQNIQL